MTELNGFTMLKVTVDDHERRLCNLELSDIQQGQKLSNLEGKTQIIQDTTSKIYVTALINLIFLGVTIAVLILGKIL
ncbi:MAG: hypothetical protein HXS43_11995 [Theionarchaea archaeon]|nr:hypothetical protein [Theionarchaea archaeon]